MEQLKKDFKYKVEKENTMRQHESQCSWYEFVLQYLKFHFFSFFCRLPRERKYSNGTSDPWDQDVILCELCDKPTQQFCNSCQVSRCDTCVKRHRDQVMSLIHEIVPFLDRKIQLVCPECQHHPGQRCEEICLQCSEPVCLKCIISVPHKGHEVEELT